MHRKVKFKAIFPFFIIIILMMLFYLFSQLHFFSWSNFKDYYIEIKNFSDSHPFSTPFLFLSVYIFYSLLSLPGIFILSVLAGFIFKQPFSTIYVIIGATIGASLLFLAARSAFGQLFYKKSGNRYLSCNMEKGFRENAVSYLLFIRLFPLFPFWITNLAGAYFNVPFWIFVWTTFVGMIPSVLVYTEAGRGLTFLLQNQEPLSPMNILNASTITALIGLSLLCFVPILFKKLNLKF